MGRRPTVWEWGEQQVVTSSPTSTSRLWGSCRSFLLGGDPEVFHHLPASALRGRVRTVPCEGGQLVEVTRTQVPPSVRGRHPEHGPGKRWAGPGQVQAGTTWVLLGAPGGHSVTWMNSSQAPQDWAQGWRCTQGLPPEQSTWHEERSAQQHTEAQLDFSEANMLFRHHAGVEIVVDVFFPRMVKAWRLCLFFYLLFSDRRTTHRSDTYSIMPSVMQDCNYWLNKYHPRNKELLLEQVMFQILWKVDGSVQTCDLCSSNRMIVILSVVVLWRGGGFDWIRVVSWTRTAAQSSHRKISWRAVLIFENFDPLVAFGHAEEITLDAGLTLQENIQNRPQTCTNHTLCNELSFASRCWLAMFLFNI